MPHAVEVMAIDPRDPQVLYVRAFMNAIVDGGELAKQALLRSIDGGATFTELWNQDGVLTPSGQSHGIDDVAIDTTRGRVLVATSRACSPAPIAGDAPTVTLQPMSSLTTAQCVDVHKGDVYACSSDYMPDFAALAESDDGAQSFHLDPQLRRHRRAGRLPGRHAGRRHLPALLADVRLAARHQLHRRRHADHRRRHGAPAPQERLRLPARRRLARALDGAGAGALIVLALLALSAVRRRV